MFRLLTSSLIKRTCACSQTCIGEQRRQAKILLGINSNKATCISTQHLRSFTSACRQKSQLACFNALHTSPVQNLMGRLQHGQTTTTTPASYSHSQHRHNSQYVAGARYVEMLKENDEVCEKALRTGQFAVFYDLRAFIEGDKMSKRMKLAWRGADDMNEVLELVEGLELTDAVLLNSTRNDLDQPARFAINIPKADGTLQQSLERLMEAETIGIRRALFTLGRGNIHEYLQAYALLQWHSLQAFCSKCGAKNKTNLAGSRRICSSCSEVHYPTMKPIVITLVTNGDRCLVARQPQFPPGMYSALAGFCDMGETLEDAVRREVAEEVGLEVKDITYCSSQHWPIPSSGLMLGCYASVKEDDQILIDKNELEDAKWMDREEVHHILQQPPGQSSTWFPPRHAIAHHLISGWVSKK
nr:NAD(P)H pyrophosphatase NUDT13, mitochondrial-like [Lytechinus pictus]